MQDFTKYGWLHGEHILLAWAGFRNSLEVLLLGYIKSVVTDHQYTASYRFQLLRKYTVS